MLTSKQAEADSRIAEISRFEERMELAEEYSKVLLVALAYIGELTAERV